MMYDRLDLAYTDWGGYIVDDYLKVGIQICEKLLVRWNGIQALVNSNDETIARGITSVDEFRDILKSHSGDLGYLQAVFFNPLVPTEPYVHRLTIAKTMMGISEYDNAVYFKLNRELTNDLVTVMKEIACMKEIEELWLGDMKAGFMGNLYFLYRPHKIYKDLTFPRIKPQLKQLLHFLQTYLPKEIIIDAIIQEMGEESIEFLEGDKIFVRFYSDQLFQIKHDKVSLLNNIQKRVESYLSKKGVDF